MTSKYTLLNYDKTLKLRAKISRSACKTNWNDVKEFPFWKIYIPRFYTCIPISESHNQCFTKSCMQIWRFHIYDRFHKKLFVYSHDVCSGFVIQFQILFNKILLCFAVLQVLLLQMMWIFYKFCISTGYVFHPFSVGGLNTTACWKDCNRSSSIGCQCCCNKSDIEIKPGTWPR